MGNLQSAYNGGMMWNTRYQRSRVCFICGLLFTVISLLAGVTGGYAGEERSEGISLSVLSEGEGVWRVCLSRGLEEITEGRAMAFLFALEVSEGMEIDRVEACGGAEGLHLTVGEAVGYKVSVLLDGYAAEVGEEAENGTILRVYTKGEGGYMGVTAGNCGKMVIYCLQDDGQVMEIPVRIMDEIPLETEKISAEATESESESEPFWEETEEETPPCTNGEAAPETEEESERSEPNRFMGCRESLPRNGAFSVQFLFYGEGEDTPVVCFGGGGAISVDTSRREDGWSLCTFRGLDGGKRYEFWVYTEKGRISVIYEGGAFRGFAS
jgi:hypothetical protein